MAKATTISFQKKKKDYFESYGVGKYFSYYKGIIRKKKSYIKMINYFMKR